MIPSRQPARDPRGCQRLGSCGIWVRRYFYSDAISPYDPHCTKSTHRLLRRLLCNPSALSRRDVMQQRPPHFLSL